MLSVEHVWELILAERVPARHMRRHGRTERDQNYCQNRRARHDYELLEFYEAGLVLTGTEIKSVRANRVSLQQAYVQAKGGELWLVEANIAGIHSRQSRQP